MKKLLALLFLSTSLASCSKKDDNPAPAPMVTPTIVGSWTLTDSKTVNTKAGVSTTITETFALTDYTLKFTADNKLIQTFGKSFAPPNGGVQTNDYTYTNGLIVLALNSSTTTATIYKVESLTTNGLVLSYDSTPPGVSDTDYVTLTFTR